MGKAKKAKKTKQRRAAALVGMAAGVIPVVVAAVPTVVEAVAKARREIEARSGDSKPKARKSKSNRKSKTT